ncbi:hypothetical protein D3C85_811550 [compost metagenome]
MLVYVREDTTIYWIPGSVLAGPTVWEKFDVTKYVNYIWKDPLNVTENAGKFEVSIDEKRIVPLIVNEEEGYALLAGPDGPVWQQFDRLPSRDTAQAGWALILDSNKDLIWGPVTGLPPTDGVAEGSAVVLGPSGPEWGAVSGTGANRQELAVPMFAINPGISQVANIDLTSASMMILSLQVDQPDILVELHQTDSYTDTNPYAFRSSEFMLVDDGTTVSEVGDISRQRRFAFYIAAVKEAPKMFIKMTNEGLETVDVQLQMTVLPME